MGAPSALALAVGPLIVEIRHDGSAASSSGLWSALGHLHVEPAVDPDRVVTLTALLGGRVRVASGDDDVTVTQVEGATEAVVALLNRLVLGAESDRDHLHAATIAAGGRAAIVVGPSEAGKTTFAARAAAAGWSVLSDEMVAIADDGTSLTTWRRPLMVRRSAAAEAPTAGVAPPQAVPVDRLGAEQPTAGVAGLMVVLDRSDGASAVEASSMAPAEVLCALAENSLDLERHPDRGRRTLARTAATVPGVRLRYREADEALAVVADLLVAAADHRPVAVHEVPVTASPDPGGVRAHPDVRTVVLGDRAVVHAFDPVRLVRLDPSATQEWLQLARGGTMSEDLQRDLLGLGLLAEAPTAQRGRR